MEFPADSPLLRIGELSRRLGVSDHVLRGWTNRYGLLQLQRNRWRIGYLGAGGDLCEHFAAEVNAVGGEAIVVNDLSAAKSQLERWLDRQGQC